MFQSTLPHKAMPEYDRKCIFLRDYMNTDTEKVAAMMLTSDILPYSLVSNRYCDRMLRGCKEQFWRMHENLCKKPESMKANKENAIVTLAEKYLESQSKIKKG